MKQSIFKKEVFATGSQCTVKAEIVATMNYTTKKIFGTHAVTHDDYERNIPVHKVEVFINGSLWQSKTELASEQSVYNESQRLIKLAQDHCQNLANSEPVKSFGEKMKELFSVNDETFFESDEDKKRFEDWLVDTNMTKTELPRHIKYKIFKNQTAAKTPHP